ncbi:MAG: hypothetical protein RLZZ609_2782 [Cyanobacteriota bacterium]|jgi:beta-lactamase class D
MPCRVSAGSSRSANGTPSLHAGQTLSITAKEQTRCLSALAHRSLPSPPQGPRAGGGDHANGQPQGVGVGWWVGRVEKVDQDTPLALNIASDGGTPACKPWGRAWARKGASP